MAKNADMQHAPFDTALVPAIWELARSGDLRGGTDAARKALGKLDAPPPPACRVELHLVARGMASSPRLRAILGR